MKKKLTATPKKKPKGTRKRNAKGTRKTKPTTTPKRRRQNRERDGGLTTVKIGDQQPLHVDDMPEDVRIIPVPLLPVDAKLLPRLLQRRVPLASQTSRVENPELANLPFACVGKLLTRFPNTPPGVIWSSSAWRAGASGIFTAAHSVFNQSEGGMMVWGEFVPQFSADAVPQAPHGVFNITECSVPSLWSSTEDHRLDMASCRVSGLPTAVPIVNNMVDWRDAAFVMSAVGFPAQQNAGYPFNGGTMWQTRGQASLRRLMPVTAGYEAFMTSPLSPGSSGGPWIVQFRGVWTVFALTSRGDGNIILSPEITSRNQAVRQLLNFVA
jgi:hypothetical protein